MSRGCQSYPKLLFCQYFIVLCIKWYIQGELIRIFLSVCNLHKLGLTTYKIIIFSNDIFLFIWHKYVHLSICHCQISIITNPNQKYNHAPTTMGETCCSRDSLSLTLVMAVQGLFVDCHLPQAAQGQFFKNSLNRIFGPLYALLSLNKYKSYLPLIYTIL